MHTYKLFLIFVYCMFSISNSDLPFYTDDENEKKIREKIKGKQRVQDIYVKMQENRDNWSEKITTEIERSNRLINKQIVLGDRYNVIRDYFVIKNVKQCIKVKGGVAYHAFKPIDSNERIQMSKKYESIHLEGFEINCLSYMMPGSEGMAIVSLYDDRFVDKSKGFLGWIGFNLGKKVSNARIKVDYSVSCEDDRNWVAIVMIYDHGLSDDMTPCNVHIKTLYKYTNHLNRFDSKLNNLALNRIQIDDENRQFSQASIRNSLDYSYAVLSNKDFLKGLSKSEEQILTKACFENRPICIKEVETKINLPEIDAHGNFCLDSKIIFESPTLKAMSKEELIKYIKRIRQADCRPMQFEIGSTSNCKSPESSNDSVPLF